MQKHALIPKSQLEAGTVTFLIRRIITIETNQTLAARITRQTPTLQSGGVW